MSKMIPIRPNGVFKLSQPEMNCLSWYVLSGCKREEAFAAFVRPDLSGTPTLLAQYASQFFASQPALAYIKAYEDRVHLVLNPPKEDKPKASLTKEELDKRNREAVQRVVEWVVSNSQSIDDMEHPEELIKMMRQLGMLEDEDIVEEAPRRYLPEMCSTCRYKAFIEDNCDDECERCQYKIKCNEDGFSVPIEKQLISNK